MFLDRFFEDSAALYPDSIALEQGETQLRRSYP